MAQVIDERQKYGYFWVRQIEKRPVSTPPLNRLVGRRGYLDVEAEALTELFVGGGEMRLVGDQMVQAFSRRGNELVVPGSSIKGAVRSYVEALSESCIGVSDDKYAQACKSCVSCALFGALGNAGRARFDDAVIIGGTVAREIDQRWTPQRPGPDNESGVFRKFYARTYVRPSSLEEPGKEWIEAANLPRFCTRLTFDGLNDRELGLLLLAMGLASAHPFAVKLGGAKNRGLGLVRLQVIGGESAPAQQWLLGQKELINLAQRQSWIDAYLAEAAGTTIERAIIETMDWFQKEYRHGS